MSEKDPFYVGYLPLPKAIKRFIVPWLVGNAVLAIGIAAVVASQHRAPGNGVWDTSQVVQIEGVLQTAPYPVLHGYDGRAYILVEQGKLGAQQRIESAGIALPNTSVSVAGYLIERDGRKVLEIDGTMQDPISRLTGLPPVGLPYPPDQPRWPSQLLDLGTHTLRGEIVDPKCYLGVMQPGDGKTHKVCATLCISGGIPPMFLVRDDKGNTAAYLLTDEQGGAIPESVYPYIADPIELTGQVFRDGDLLIMQADLGSIKRLQ